MKNHSNLNRMNLTNFDLKKKQFEERLKKRMKENKEKMSNKEKRINKQGNIMEKKINYEKRSIKIDKTMYGNNNLLKNMKLNSNNNSSNNSNNNSKLINNSGFIKKEKYKKENNINNKTANNEKNLIIKKIITNQNINKNYNSNSNILNQNAKTTNDIHTANKIPNNKNKYINKTIDIDDKRENINSTNNFKCAINNNILYLINSSNGNPLENFGIDTLNEKRPVHKNNSSSKIYSSLNKDLRILNYNETNNNYNRNVIQTNKNYYGNRNIRTTKTINVENNSNHSNYIYKKTARNNSCFKREKFYQNFGSQIKKENDENITNKNLNSSLPAFYIKKDKSFSICINEENKNKMYFDENNDISFPINEDFNRKINNKKYFLYQNGMNDNKSFIEKSYNMSNVYNKIKTKRMIKTSLRKRRLTNSFAHKEKDINEVDKNNKTIYINKQKEFNHLKEYNNYCNIYLNDEINERNNNFNKTSIDIYQNSKKIFDTLKSKNDKDAIIKKREKFFYNDKKTLENFFINRNKNKDLNSKVEDMGKNYPPKLKHMNSPVYINKFDNFTKTNNNKVYYKKNIVDKKFELNSFSKAKTLKKEKSLNSSSNNDKEIKDENSIKDSEIDSSFIEVIKETVNNYHCFQKKLYNYFKKKQEIKPYYIDKITLKKNKKEKSLNSNSFNLQNLSEIENKTSSIKNISKDYELSEFDEKKNSIENEKITEDKKTKLSSFQKISLAAKKLNEIFEKKNEPEINKKVRRTMTEEKFYLGYSKLNDVIHKKTNLLNQNESTKEETNNNIQINKKVLTYKMPLKNKLELEEEDNNIKIEAHHDSFKKQKIIRDEMNNDYKKIKFTNTNNNFYSKINESNNSDNSKNNTEKKKSKKKSRSSEKRNLEKLINKEIKKENEIEEINKTIILKDLENYLNYLEKEKINNKEDIYEGISDSYDWKIIDELITEKNLKIEDIIKIYIDICKGNNFINENTIFKANEYIKTIIEYYTSNLSKNQKEIIHLNMIEIFNDIDNILNNTNEYIYEIVGNLFFILLKNKLYYMKDLNNFIEKERSTQINIAKMVKYSILSSGNLAKQYHNDFKYTKLFNNNDIFVNYITKEIYDKENK